MAHAKASAHFLIASLNQQMAHAKASAHFLIASLNQQMAHIRPTLYYTILSIVEMIVEGVTIILVAVTLTYIILYFMGGEASYISKNALYNLSTPSQTVLTPDNFVWGTAPCALRFGIYVQEAPRTLSKVDCIDISPTTPVTSFSPSCKDYTYQTCQCTGMNCSPGCTLSQDSGSYLSKLLNCGDNIELWASGYTSQNDKPYIPAILKIRTGKDSSQHYMESISLPAIPLQKWCIITIVKEGRRFDVYYGSKNVSSKLLQYMPIAPSSTGNWYAGNQRWKGQIGFFNGFNKSWSSNDVDTDMKNLLNTRGVPNYMEQIQISVDDFKNLIPSCPFGNCNRLPAVKPPSMGPFMVYASNVS
jgi:hypothetical protein